MHKSMQYRSAICSRCHLECVAVDLSSGVKLLGREFDHRVDRYCYGQDVNEDGMTCRL